MGKECLWGGGKSSRRGGGGESDNARTSGCMCSMFQLFHFHQYPFVLHQQQLSSEPSNSFLLEPAPISTGTEAPRNSLGELHQKKPSLPIGIQVKTKGDARSNVQGAAKDSSSASDISSSPATKTPTLVARLMGLDLLPDQSSSPRHSSSSTQGTSHLEGKSHVQQPLRSRHPLQRKSASHRSSFDRGTRSLPETPRISSARISDVEHRLSLQINKENVNSTVSEEMVFSGFSSLKRNELKTGNDSRTPGHQASQIVKQIKDSVSRKVGLDITNMVSSREEERREHEPVSHLNSKKFSKALTRASVELSSSGKHSTSSCSPRQKSLDPKKKPITSKADTAMLSKDHHILQTPKQPFLSFSQVNILSSQNTKKPCTKPNSQAVKEYHHRHHHKQIKLRKNVTEERFGPPLRLKKLPQTTELVVRNKQKQLFVRPTKATRANIPNKKCKKPPFLNGFLHNITVSALLPVKKAQLHPKQVLPSAQESKCISQLSSCSSPSYKTKTLNSRDSYNESNVEDRTNGATTCSTTGGGAAKEYEYITKTLRSTGTEKENRISCIRWLSPSHPLDPSISYLTAHFTTSEKCPFGQLARCCNRRLLFQLVHEVLADILNRPLISRKPCAGSSIIRQEFIRGHMERSQLVDMLCSRVRNFARSNCQVLEDIDALIDKDLTQLWLRGEVALDEEGERIATEIEMDIIDKLIQETAMAFA